MRPLQKRCKGRRKSFKRLGSRDRKKLWISRRSLRISFRFPWISFRAPQDLDFLPGPDWTTGAKKDGVFVAAACA
jgi:hypothetical protein